MKSFGESRAVDSVQLKVDSYFGKEDLLWLKKIKKK